MHNSNEQLKKQYIKLWHDTKVNAKANFTRSEMCENYNLLIGGMAFALGIPTVWLAIPTTGIVSIDKFHEAVKGSKFFTKFYIPISFITFSFVGLYNVANYPKRITHHQKIGAKYNVLSRKLEQSINDNDFDSTKLQEMNNKRDSIEKKIKYQVNNGIHSYALSVVLCGLIYHDEKLNNYSPPSLTLFYYITRFFSSNLDERNKEQKKALEEGGTLKFKR